MYMTTCTPSEVFNIIKNMKITRNNVSKLGSITLKYVNIALSYPIANIFSSIVNNGKYPSKLIISTFERGQPAMRQLDSSTTPINL